jgi:small subunit ribosomal protein S17
MADEDNKNEETTPEETVEETPAAEAPTEEAPVEEPATDEAPAEEAAAEEAPAEDAPAEDEAPADEAPAEEEPAADEPAAEEEPAEDAAADEPAAEAAPAPDDDSEPEAPLTSKQRRRRERSTHTGEALPQRSPEDRAAERAERRKARATNRRAYRSKQKAKKGEPGQGTPPAEREPGKPKVRQGVVVSDKADKTITVRIDVTRRHRTYKKIVRESSTLHAHDEQNEAAAGDTVRVIESRPLSRTKRWRLVEVVEKAR